MKINVSIENNDALPVPYIGKCGENIIPYSLNKNSPILMEVTAIWVTPTRQILIHGVKNDVILPLTPSVIINFV